MTVLARIHSEYLNLIQSHRVKMRPAILQITDSQSIWGDWNPSTRTIRLSQKLMDLANWYQLTSVLKHEMAHQIVSEILQSMDSHGPDFQKACDMIGVPLEFRNASVDFQSFPLDWRQRNESPGKVSKIQKLLSLTSSSNPFEAELALIKAQHLGSTLNLNDQSQHKRNFYYHHQLKSKKGNISRLDKEMLHFLIQHYSVFGFIGQSYCLQKNQEEKTLEIMGLKENVLIADYVFQFLTRVMQVKSKFTKGSRLSFQSGILEGFKTKLIVNTNQNEVQALVTVPLSPQLKKYAGTIHPNLRSRSIGQGENIRNSENFQEGFRQGKQIQIHQPIDKENKKSNPLALLLNSRSLD
jgi:hypothetical protein